MLQCPVCLLRFDELDAEDNSEYRGKSYYFCSEECKESFDRDPEAYAKAPLRRAAP